MTILSRDFVFVYLAQQTDFISEVEITMELESSVSLVRQHLKDLGDVVETDGDGNWRIKTEEEQRCLTWTNDNRYVWCARQSEKEIEEVSDRSLLLKELEQLHNLRQEFFVYAHNTFDDLKKNQLLAAVREKDEQIAWVKQKLGLSETDNYQIELYIHFIQRDGGTQPREAMDENTVSEYAEAMGEGTKFPPVTVFFDGEFWLADGFHRLKATEKIGLLKITVEVKQGSLRDAVLYSCGANATHGLRRSNVDKRRAVLRLLEDREWSQWSDRSIARSCGVHHKMVGRLRSSLELSSSERKYTTKHGTTASMETRKIGKTESVTAKQQKENQSIIKESLDLKKAKNKSIKSQKKEGLNYKPGLGCEWYVKVNQETYEKIKDYQARLGIATLDRVINELLDLAQNTNRDD